jgi:hypothetical protein
LLQESYEISQPHNLCVGDFQRNVEMYVELKKQWKIDSQEHVGTELNCYEHLKIENELNQLTTYLIITMKCIE